MLDDWLVKITKNELLQNQLNLKSEKEIIIIDRRKSQISFNPKHKRTVYFPNGSFYEGNIISITNGIEGSGKLSYLNGDYYTGGFKNGVFEGKGVYLDFKKNDFYDGMYSIGEFVLDIEKEQEFEILAEEWLEDLYKKILHKKFVENNWIDLNPI